MVREKSELLPLPLNRAGVPECLVLPFLIRSFGVCPGFCWYQYIHGAPPPHVATAELVLQVRVTVDPGVDVTSGGWVTVTWPLHPVDKKTPKSLIYQQREERGQAARRVAERENLWSCSRPASRWGWWRWESWWFVVSAVSTWRVWVLQRWTHRTINLLSSLEDQLTMQSLHSMEMNRLKATCDTKPGASLLGFTTSIYDLIGIKGNINIRSAVEDLMTGLYTLLLVWFICLPLM